MQVFIQECRNTEWHRMGTRVVRYKGVSLEASSLTNRRTRSSSLGKTLETEEHVLSVIALEELGKYLL